MLLEDFYKINDSREDSDKTTYILALNPDHAIFRGHFPDMPVVPGVCMMQMAKELIEYRYGKKTRLVKAGNLKFLSILNPHVHSLVNLEIQAKSMAGAEWTVSAKLYNDQSVFFKMDAQFQVK